VVLPKFELHLICVPSELPTPLLVEQLQLVVLHRRAPNPAACGLVVVVGQLGAALNDVCEL
jgi:hypothetical protein